MECAGGYCGGRARPHGGEGRRSLMATRLGALRHPFLFVRFDGGTHIGIEDRSAAEGFSRSVVEAHWDGLSGRPRWAPDGTRFLFKSGRQLMVTDAAGVRQIALAEIGASVSFTWSPDGQWIAFERSEG